MSEAGVTLIMFVVAVTAFVVLRLVVHGMAEQEPRPKQTRIPEPRAESALVPDQERSAA